MKFKEYEILDGRKAVFWYDENGVGKITLECMDMLMGLINDRKTEPQTCSTCNFEDCDRAEYPCVYCINEDKMWQPKDEPQTEYDKYREKIRPHDPHKDWFEDEPQTDCAWK